MDEIPLPLKPALKSPYPTDEQIMHRIYEAVAAKPPLAAPVMLNLPTG
jgi:formylmethanofuran dehydrogenase subunit B